MSNFGLASRAANDTVCAVIVLREDGACVLQHRDNKPHLRAANMWVFPGGHASPGEPLETCARRELQEETAYAADALKWLATIPDVYSPGLPSYQLVIFWTRYDGRQEIQCFEGQSMEFISRTRAADLAMAPYLLTIWDLALIAARQSH